MEATLNATVRDSRGKNENRRLRAAGRIPAVVYGSGGANKDAGSVAVAVDPKELLRILRSDSGANTLIALTTGDGEAARVLVKAYQLDPLSHSLLHVDFYRVAMDRAVTVAVPISLIGEARGVKQQGGLMEFMHREVLVESLPASIPEHLSVDVTELMIGQGVRLRDLTEGVDWKPITDPDTLLVHIVSPKAAETTEEAEEAPAATPAEPELVKKGKGETPESE